jgi:hypothetical protein
MFVPIVPTPVLFANHELLKVTAWAGKALKAIRPEKINGRTILILVFIEYSFLLFEKIIVTLRKAG